MPVEPKAPLPLWQQLVEAIRENIATGRWRLNEQIPSERELCALFGVSRNTVRQAIAEAVSAGLLTRVHGKGTFVSQPKVHPLLYHMTGFAETIRAQGLEPGTRLVDRGTRPAPPGAAEGLLGKHPASLTYARVLGLASGEPVALYDSWLPPDIGPEVLRELERRLQAGELVFINQIIGDLYQWPYLDAHQTYSVSTAGAEAVRLLGLSRHVPVFVVTTLFTSPGGRPVEYRRAVYRGDRYQFQIRRQVALGPPDTPPAPTGRPAAGAGPGRR